MIELQLLNYVLQYASINLLVQNNITPEKFSTSYQNEAVFIYNHYNKYGKVPDRATMLEHFEDFDIIDVDESEKYLVEKFRETLIYRLQLDAANDWGEALADPDSEKSLKVIKDKLNEIENINVGNTVGVDIIKQTDRFGRYKEALHNPTVTGIPTKIKHLDAIIHGILNNDLTVIAARTNQGKSFIGLKIAENIWTQNKRVLFYSGENSVLNTGYRFDTLYKNFSNSGLMFGHPDLKNSRTEEDYEKYIEELKNNENPFVVVTPSELNGERLGVQKMKALNEIYKPDIIFLDQLSLMKDDRAQMGTKERLKYSHIMEDLRLFIESNHVPVVVMSQTSRNNTIDDNGILKPARIEHLSESDGVGQNATKVITFAVNEGILNMMVRKNTNGEKERGFKMIWDIDTGVFDEFKEPEEMEDDLPQSFDDDDSENGEDVF